MNRLFIALFAVCLSVNARVKYDSFEKGVPGHWVLQGRGKLSTSPWHYKEGKKSLQWDFKAGDVICINNTLGRITGRGGWKKRGRPSFAMYVYMPKPLKGQSLSLAFRTGKKTSASINIPINFSGWQTIFINYYKMLKGKVSAQTDNILIKAPKNCDGRAYIDLVVYTGYIDGRTSKIPLKNPWTPPKPSEKIKNSVKTLSAADLAVLRKMKERLVPRVKITQRACNAAAFAKAIKGLDYFKIVEDSHGIRGIPIQIPNYQSTANRSDSFFRDNGVKCPLYSYARTVRKNIRPARGVLRSGVNQAQFAELSAKTIAFFKYFMDQGFNPSMGYPSFNYVHHREVIFALVCMLQDDLARAKILTPALNMLQYDKNAVFNPPARKPTMDYFAAVPDAYVTALLARDTKVQAQGVKYLSERLSTEILNGSAKDGFKADGCGFHHGRNYYGYMSNALRAISKIIKYTANSRFALEPAAVKVIEKAALNAYYYSINKSFPLSMQGRQPFSPRFKYTANALKVILSNLAPSTDNKNIMQAYVNLAPADTAYAKKHGIKPKFMEQTFCLPYGGLQIHRRNKYLAFAAAYGKYFNGDEIYTGYNRYGRYISKGSLDIIGPKGLYASGTDPKGWDWRRINGTTVIYYLLEKMKCQNPYVHFVNKHGFFGGISWRKRNACFTMQLENVGSDYKNAVLSGKKSYFFIGDRIYALGSNIKSNVKDCDVQTNLFQKSFYNKPFKKLNKSFRTTQHLIDPVGNGYFVPAGQKLHLEQKTQENYDDQDRKKAKGNFAVAYIDHGKAPKNASYFYVVFPFCKEPEFKKFDSKAYKILQQDENAHIIYDKKSKIYGAIFFKKNTNSKLPKVLSVSDNCMIMYRYCGRELEIAAGNPDVNRRNIKDSNYLNGWRESVPKAVNITFSGRWQLADKVKGVSIISGTANSTVIKINCIDGKSFNFTLKK